MKIYKLVTTIIFSATTAFAGLEEAINSILQSHDKDGKKYNIVLSGRLPDGHDMRWVLVHFQGGYLERMLKILQMKSTEISYVKGPFLSETSVVLKCWSSSGDPIFIIRLWNSTASIELKGSSSRSFTFENEEVASEIRSLVNEMLKKNGTNGVFAFESADSKESLLMKLGLSDPET